ncbi:gibberellin 20 oxidase 2-like [Mercurialis annua]|uniref:gibberellin 20 oxidase 2-like n=1 Tax=Mercurialis annua TaxID=3986 RepID=UPI00215EB10C|nr:gibberellin 20 oxidase 2-like [Mercurialis annua]
MDPILVLSSALDSQRQNDTSFLQNKTIPKEFQWPKDELVRAQKELMVPIVDLQGFLKGDEMETLKAVNMIKPACLEHGFFQVINHGVDSNVIKMANDHMDHFFKLPDSEKLKARKMPGRTWGYSSAHSDRFSTKLPWKEMLSFGYHQNSSDPVVFDFFKSTLGKDFEETGMVYQKYCEAMNELSLSLLELLAISLGVDRFQYRNFYEDNCSLMRCNFYPICQEPNLALGTGPHCDPTTLTILHQDQVGGLEVFTNNQWHTVPPRPGALVINIGDTFTALSNGIYKSCLHRAVVNQHENRKSMAFFLCPKEDKVVTPPANLITGTGEGKRKYPDFTWSQLLHFTQKHYRADSDTLQNFSSWLISSESSNV